MSDFLFQFLFIFKNCRQLTNHYFYILLKNSHLFKKKYSYYHFLFLCIIQKKVKRFFYFRLCENQPGATAMQSIHVSVIGRNAKDSITRVTQEHKIFSSVKEFVDHHCDDPTKGRPISKVCNSAKYLF